MVHSRPPAVAGFGAPNRTRRQGGGLSRRGRNRV